ncbi:MAG TPA: DegT/DnrJ/EryC1/StrS family aminotransferase [Planctomycetes bacterium]|nr:DegT/DnrJ/EryC1/StrS family aminotransferase [Planctomycetota bacterium]
MEPSQTAGPPEKTAPVPLLDLSRQLRPLRGDILAAIARVCDSGQFCLGPEVQRLEENIARYCGAEYAVGCASGSDALLLALMACDVGPGDEVILPSFTFFATASAVTRLGARPVFGDIDPVSFNLQPAEVERLIGPATKAVVPVHLFGQCAQMDTIGRLAEGAGVAVIEDAAQALGAEFHGRRAGGLGGAGCFSFYPSKNLGGAGDGGMVTTSDPEWADRLTLLRTHGMRPRYFHPVVGINSRLDAFQAAVLNVKLPHLERWAAMRRANARRYAEMFTDGRLDRVLGLPAELPGRRHVWNQYVIRVPDGRRDGLKAFLAEARIGSEIYYPLGLHQQECFRHLGYATGDLPETERAAAEVLALPIFAELTAEEQQRVVRRIEAFFHGSSGPHRLAGPNFLRRPRAGRPST